MDDLRALLGADGPLARSIDGFAPRGAQQDMAEAVAAALDAEGALVVEAGTGTGKTFAYLVPALLSGRRVVISTGTKNLQDQLFHRDLPRVKDALAVPARTALLKGRANYLCLYRMKRARHLPALRVFHDRLREVEDWARRTDTGELAELGSIAELEPLARQLTSTADNCLSSRCPDFEQCHVAKARRAAQGAEVAVINHHLLFADFLLKDEGFGQILSGTEAVIVDEAHQLAELATQFFGVRVSTRQLQDLARDVAEEAARAGDVPAVREAAEHVAAETVRLDGCFVGLAPRMRLADFLARGDTALQLGRAQTALDELFGSLKPLEERSAEFSSFVARCADLVGRLHTITGGPDDTVVRWVESTGRSGSLQATPIDVAEAFRRMTATYPGAWVFTSATLSASDDFAHFVAQLGLEQARRVQLDSPFDFAAQARLFLPSAMPDPNAPGYADAVAAAALPLIEASGGGAFVLCTSHKALRQIAEALRATLSLRVLAQGDDSRSALLDAFTADGDAVLVGTSSFWEGVDVKGRALRLVIIDKLPFAAPGDPVFEARLEAVRRGGGNAFFDVQLPEAIVMLRQGVGRLIRDPSDRGLLVLCDPRVRTRRYGARVLAALPRMPVLTDPTAAQAWLRQISLEPATA